METVCTVKPGAVLPNERLSDDTYLSDLLCNGFTLIVLEEKDPGGLDDLKASLQSLDPDLEIITSGHIRARFGVVGLSRLHERLGTQPGATLLIRPDGYLAGAWPTCVAGDIVAQVTAAFGRKETH